MIMVLQLSYKIILLLGILAFAQNAEAGRWRSLIAVSAAQTILTPRIQTPSEIITQTIPSKNVQEIEKKEEKTETVKQTPTVNQPQQRYSRRFFRR